MSDWTGNYNSIFKILGASSHTDKEREKDDYYATDPVAVDKLLMKESGGSAVAYAWFVWQKGYNGVTEVKWI